MAATLTLFAASPYALKYAYDYDGTGGAGSATVSVTQAQLIADAKLAGPGPSVLAPYFDGITDDISWGSLDESAQISLYTRLKDPAANALGAKFASLGGRKLTVAGTDGAASFAHIEIRFFNSITQ